MKPADLPTSAAQPRPLTDPDLLKAGDALRRSARKALDLARQTGTPCYVWQDGRIVNIGAAAAPMPASPAA
jgi:hypothetical protein